MTVTAQQLEQARRFAIEAARRGRPVTACPYNANGTPEQRRLALAFVRAYLAETDDVTDYGDDAELD
jgi:hypothetical protein